MANLSRIGSDSMFTILSVVALLLVAVTMGTLIGPCLGISRQMRLDESTYRAVQAIYYPGFTIGGLIGEFGAMLALIVSS